MEKPFRSVANLSSRSTLITALRGQMKKIFLEMILTMIREKPTHETTQETSILRMMILKIHKTSRETGMMEHLATCTAPEFLALARAQR